MENFQGHPAALQGWHCHPQVPMAVRLPRNAEGEQCGPRERFLLPKQPEQHHRLLLQLKLTFLAAPVLTQLGTDRVTVITINGWLKMALGAAI